MKKPTKFRGVSFRKDRQTYVYAQMQKGHRRCFYLHTSDLDEAIRKARRIKAGLEIGSGQPPHDAPEPVRAEEVADRIALHRNVSKLNALFSPFSPWKSTKAKKPHIDAFGHEIARATKYFSQAGSSEWDVTRLSELSMERLLECIISRYSLLEQILDGLLDAEAKGDGSLTVRMYPRM